MRRGIWLGLSALVILASLVAACGQAPPQPTAIGQAAVATPTEAPATPTPEPTATPTPEPSATPTPPPSPTVEPTPTRAVPQNRPIAVVVENEPRARPQTGLVDADVAYEAVAEFNLTRFVGIYVDSSPEVVGSVRSARAYHGAIAAEYEAGLAHCLDVPSLKEVLAATKVVNMDGCKVTGPAGFWRDSKRVMPHNLYVGVPTLRKAAGGQGTYGGFDKRRPWPDSGDQVGKISFVYPEEHPIVWRYDPSRGEYLRWQDGAPHLDVSGRQLAFKSVVAQQVAVRHSAYWGESGYHELTLTGSGEAVLYANGRKRTATWRRGSLADPTRYFDAQGEEILLPPGKVFVQLVGMGTAITETR